MKGLSFILFILGLGGITGELLNLQLPTMSWYFDTSRRIPFFNVDGFPLSGWILSISSVLLGGYLFWRAYEKVPHPTTIRRKERFVGIKRGVWAMRILLFFIFLASLDQVLVGKKPLVLRYENEFYFPAFQTEDYLGEKFGLTGDKALTSVNYRELEHAFDAETEEGNWMLMPPIPYAPTGDSLPPLLEPLERNQAGQALLKGKTFSGLASRFFDKEKLQQHLRTRFRNGFAQGAAEGWTRKGDRAYTATYEEGMLTKDDFFEEGEKSAYLEETPEQYYKIYYHPAPPSWKNRNLLGTTSEGYDVLAYLYGGLQVNIQAALFYIPFIYFIGITIGLLMGFFGGAFDLLAQRIIEALEAIPFLFVVIIISGIVPVELKGLGMILAILALFGWMGMTYLMRTAALKEKAKDYIASSRVIGAGTPRILFKHLLPNSLAIVVTLIPFSVSGIITSLTSLDYLGFGLPPQYASWGKLLNDGLENLSSPWLVSSAFIALVLVLILVTFVGEAVREAYDPKKFSTYK